MLPLATSHVHCHFKLHTNTGWIWRLLDSSAWPDRGILGFQRVQFDGIDSESLRGGPIFLSRAVKHWRLFQLIHWLIIIKSSLKDIVCLWFAPLLVSNFIVHTEAWWTLRMILAGEFYPTRTMIDEDNLCRPMNGNYVIWFSCPFIACICPKLH